MHAYTSFSTTILTSFRTVKLQHGKNCLFCNILLYTITSAHNLLFCRSTGLLWEQEYPLHHLYLSEMQKCTMWHLGEIIIHFPITPCWCDVQRWDIGTTFVSPQTSVFCCSSQEQWRNNCCSGPNLRLLLFPVMPISAARRISGKFLWHF